MEERYFRVRCAAGVHRESKTGLKFALFPDCLSTGLGFDDACCTSGAMEVGNRDDGGGSEGRHCEISWVASVRVGSAWANNLDQQGQIQQF